MALYEAKRRKILGLMENAIQVNVLNPKYPKEIGPFNGPIQDLTQYEYVIDDYYFVPGDENEIHQIR